MTDQLPPDWSHPSFSGRIGVAQRDITPPTGIYARNWGAAKHDVAESIHRPLYLSALTIQAGKETEPLVYVEADLGSWRNQQLFHELQTYVLNELSLDPSRFIFALTHTHAAATLVNPDSDLPGRDLLCAYLERFKCSTVDTVRDALDSAHDAILDWHTGRCALARMRDLPDPDPGRNRMVCGYNPCVRADDTLLVGRVTSRSGKPRATLVNYACHPTTLAWENSAISPDFVGAMRETIKNVTGAPALFMQGASGELAPRFQYVADAKEADRHGRQLGFAALATLEDMEPPGTKLRFDRVVESGAPLAVWRREPVVPPNIIAATRSFVELSLKPSPSAVELERQRVASDDRVLQERIRRMRDRSQNLGEEATYHMAVSVWQVGHAVFVAVPAEAYSSFQQALRQCFSNLAVVCQNVANGTLGYLAPAALYDQDVYEVACTPFARGSLELLTEATSQAVNQLLSQNANNSST